MSQEKTDQRKLIKELKQKFNRELGLAKSEEIFRKIEMMPEFTRSSTVLVYWSLPDEVNTHDFVTKWYQQKIVILPVVNGNKLDLKIFTGMECMVKGSSFGILEPQNAPDASIDEVDLVIVPGMAFDLKGNRLGRGKGYYDNLLKDSKIYKIGVCFDFQVLPNVHVCEYDIPMDTVVYA